MAMATWNPKDPSQGVYSNGSFVKMIFGVIQEWSHTDFPDHMDYATVTATKY